ncbi:hypothetical protein DSO57_1004941 [Entomophthora muscae]|uniref:Uncharacterized protein n=1 Tax=Entomophthora muscae TaxID=34485 RepID=A0ACC2T891_9FUNG|nr:hypothetical protein DSO57_1004941 [Entomophthora muscae]
MNWFASKPAMCNLNISQRKTAVSASWFKRADKALSELCSKLSGRSESSQTKATAALHRSNSLMIKAKHAQLPISSQCDLKLNTDPYSQENSLPDHYAKIDHTPVPSGTSQNGLTSNDACLKHARRRMRLAKDFDHMLKNGFPRLTLLNRTSDKDDPELTIYITLTPNVASQESL